MQNVGFPLIRECKTLLLGVKIKATLGSMYEKRLTVKSFSNKLQLNFRGHRSCNPVLLKMFSTSHLGQPLWRQRVSFLDRLLSNKGFLASENNSSELDMLT